MSGVYSSGIDGSGWDAPLWSTHVTCADSWAGASRVSTLTSTGIVTGVTVGPHGGTSDITAMCSTDSA